MTVSFLFRLSFCFCPCAWFDVPTTITHICLVHIQVVVLSLVCKNTLVFFFVFSFSVLSFLLSLCCDHSWFNKDIEPTFSLHHEHQQLATRYLFSTSSTHGLLAAIYTHRLALLTLASLSSFKLFHFQPLLCPLLTNRSPRRYCLEFLLFMHLILTQPRGLHIVIE